MKNWCFTYLLLALSFISHAQVTLKLDTNQILIGEQFHIDINIESGNGVKWPEWQSNLDSLLVLVKETDADTSFNGNLPSYHKSLTLTCFDSAYVVIKPILFFDQNNDTIGLSEADMIQVDNPKLVNNEPIEDIINPINVRISFWEIFPYIIIGSIIIIIIAGIIYFVKKKMKQPIAVPQKPTIPANIEALNALQELSKKQFCENNQHKAFFTELTDIWIHYAERNFNIHLIEKTTPEIWNIMKTKHDARCQEIIKDVLQLSDLVKFAKETPLLEDCKSSLEQIKKYIELTTTSTDPIKE